MWISFYLTIETLEALPSNIAICRSLKERYRRAHSNPRGWDDIRNASQQDQQRWAYGVHVLELKGTTEENPEYGTASSTVKGRERVRMIPFTALVLCDPLTAPFWMAEPEVAMVSVSQEAWKRMGLNDYLTWPVASRGSIWAFASSLYAKCQLIYSTAWTICRGPDGRRILPLQKPPRSFLLECSLAANGH